jgi:hypothetical protein
MVWFLERGPQRLVCEIRRAIDSNIYEFEVALDNGVETHRYESPSELIDEYLKRQSALRAEGWRPCVEVQAPQLVS